MRAMLRYLAIGVAGFIERADSSCVPIVRFFESDLLGKYVERLLRERGQLPNLPSASIQTTCRNAG